MCLLRRLRRVFVEFYQNIKPGVKYRENIHSEMAFKTRKNKKKIIARERKLQSSAYCIAYCFASLLFIEYSLYVIVQRRTLLLTPLLYFSIVNGSQFNKY